MRFGDAVAREKSALAFAFDPPQVARAEAGLEERHVETAQVTHCGFADDSGHVVAARQGGVQRDLAPCAVGQVARRE